jgi:hypothetical protein
MNKCNIIHYSITREIAALLFCGTTILVFRYEIKIYICIYLFICTYVEYKNVNIAINIEGAIYYTVCEMHFCTLCSVSTIEERCLELLFEL